MFRFRFLGLRTVFYRTRIDNSSLWTEVIYILYKYSINNNNNNKITLTTIINPFFKSNDPTSPKSWFFKVCH